MAITVSVSEDQTEPIPEERAFVGTGWVLLVWLWTVIRVLGEQLRGPSTWEHA